MKKLDKIFMQPTDVALKSFKNAKDAVTHLIDLYKNSTNFLCEKFVSVLDSGDNSTRYRAFYPEVRITTTSYASVDSRLSFGHVSGPGTYATTITRPVLFRYYLEQQLSLLIGNHNMTVEVGYSNTPMPVHFAVANDTSLIVPPEAAGFTLRDVFDVPDLSTTNDDIVNGETDQKLDGCQPLALFTAQRVDYSLARLAHYTATDPEHFQNHVLFTHYPFYVEEFETFARQQLDDPSSGYSAFVGTGSHQITCGDGDVGGSDKMPHMPT